MFLQFDPQLQFNCCIDADTEFSLLSWWCPYKIKKRSEVVIVLQYGSMSLFSAPLKSCGTVPLKTCFIWSNTKDYGRTSRDISIGMLSLTGEWELWLMTVWLMVVWWLSSWPKTTIYESVSQKEQTDQWSVYYTFNQPDNFVCFPRCWNCVHDEAGSIVGTFF